MTDQGFLQRYTDRNKHTLFKQLLQERKFKNEKVIKLLRTGQIWNGNDALKSGMVDQVGNTKKILNEMFDPKKYI